MSDSNDEAPSTPTFEERRRQTVWERMDEIAQECAAGHRRLRTRLEELEKQVDTTDTALRKAESRVEVIERTPTDVTKLRFSTGVVVSIIIVTISVVGTGYGVMSRIDTLSTSVQGQLKDLRNEMNTTSRNQDDRYSRLKELLDEMKIQRENDKREAAQRLSEFLQQRVNESIIGKGVKK